MDPSVYARAFGVQSEANKITVTRVACSEILYRRVVNTYKRDMNSTVTHIRREQKKLRRCMRGYRKVLHGEEKKTVKPYKFGWIANAPRGDDEGISHQSEGNSFQKLTIKQADNSRHFGHRKKTRASDLPRNEPLQAQVEAFIKAPNIVPRKVSKGDDGDINENKSRKTKGKERRLFVIGSGKIPSSERTVKDVFHGEEGVDSYSLVSDSSDEEDQVEESTGIQRTYERRLRDAKRGLVRVGSAYFKPIDVSDDGVLGNLTDNEVLARGNLSHNENSERDRLDKPSRQETLDNPNGHSIDSPTHDVHHGPMTGDLLTRGTFLPSAVLPINHGQETVETTLSPAMLGAGKGEGIQTLTPHATRGGTTTDVSFGDIAKLQHGLKTKKLFSLVDKLASRHGIVGDIPAAERHRHHPLAKDPNKRFLKGTIGDPHKDLAAYASVFYNIKYGYGHDALESPKESVLSGSPTLKVRSERFTTHSSTTIDSGVESELTTQTLPAVVVPLTTNNPTEAKRYGSSAGDDDYPQNVNKMNSILSSTNYGTEAPSSRAQDEVDHGVPEAQSLQRRRASRYQRQRRRSSMMEASQFVNSLRNKDTNKKMSFSTDMGSFDQRNSMSSEDPDAVSDMHKMSWSSALSRMKLVHTLVDLTHII